MAESGAKSHAVNTGKPCKSAWLSHWTGARAETSKHDHLSQSRSERNDSNDHDYKNRLTGVEMASDNFGFSKGVDDVDLTMSLTKPTSQFFPFFRRGQESGKLKERLQALGPQVSNDNLTSDFNLETSSRECHLQPTGQVKFHMFFGESSYKFDSQITPEPENFTHLTAAFASKPKSEKSEMPSFLRQSNTAHLKNDPSTSRHHSPALVEEQYERMQKHLGMGFFPHPTGPQQLTNSPTLHHGQYSLQNGPHFVHDVEMARMPEGLHSFSRTTHSLLITKQTDVKVYQESQFFRESRVSTQLKGEALQELSCSHPPFARSQQGVKLQLLDSSDHESQENVKDYRASRDFQKNESSADTNTMVMESIKGNHLSGLHLSPRNKDTMAETDADKDKRRKRKIELPDMNLDISAQPAASSSTEKPEPGSSRTQSLDMEALHHSRDQTTNSKSNSNECSNTNSGSDPGSRWIKRLKLAEPSSSPRRLSRFVTQVMEVKPESVLDKRQGKNPESLLDQFRPKIPKFKTGEATKHECEDITLSHSWIQRWCHKQNEKNLETVETCQLDNSKFEIEELQKKQFPSIAAMALMGKAMTGFSQFKLQKKRSLAVWNTKVFD